MKSKLIARSIFALSLFPWSPDVQAASPIVSIPQDMWDPHELGLESEVHGNGMVGWTFRVTNPVIATHIGWHDRGGDGLSRAFQVGLWHDTSGGFFGEGSPVVELLGTAGSGMVIPAGTNTLLNGHFRVMSLAVPIELQPGHYQIAGLDTASTPDPITYMWNVGGMLNTPDVSVGSFFHAGTTESDFTWVDNSRFHLSSGLEMGPMVFIVPEASASILIIFGLVMAISKRRAHRHH